MDVELIEWDDANVLHATGHGVTQTEIEQVLMNRIAVRTNRRGRAGTHQVLGTTDGGREVVVTVLYRPDTRTVRPITAWEVGR